MKRYLVIDEYKGVLGATDKLDDIEGDGGLEVVDTQTEAILRYSGSGWREVWKLGEYRSSVPKQETPIRYGKSYFLSVDNGDDANDGMSPGAAKKTLQAALADSGGDPRRSKIIVLGNGEAINAKS